MTSPELDERGARLSASTSSVLNLAALIDAVVRAGGKAATLLRRVGVASEVLRRPDARIPFDALLRAWEVAPGLVRDADFGLHFGVGLRRGAFGLVEYAARASDTLGDAIERLVRLQRLLHDRARFSLAVTGARATVQIRVADLPEGAPRHFNEALAGSLLCLARELTGVDLQPVAVAFQHAEPAELGEHRRLFRAPLAFGAGENQIVLRRAQLELPLREADPALAGVLDQCGAAALERLPPVSGVMLCRELIASRIGAGVRPRVGDIARELALSPRSLQRILGESQLSFRDVVDDVRKQLALAWASNSSEHAAQIAYRLGYADASAFHHAFRRWTGHTVGELRRRRALTGRR